MEGIKKALGPDHEDVADSANFLARLLSLEKKREEALSLLRHAVEHGLAAEDDLKIAKDPHLQGLHRTLEFVEFVADGERQAAAKTKN